VNKIDNSVEYGRWKVADLKPHRRQADLFGNLPDHELQQLAKSIKRDGLNQAIEILPDGTIICGHQRFLAVQFLGWNEVEVVIRYDLAVAGEAAVERRMIEDNLIRRQLTRLHRVCCAARLVGPITKGQRSFAAACERVAAQMCVSRRTAERLLLIAGTPRVLQDAYDQGYLPQVLAARVARLPESRQSEIAREIEEVGIRYAKQIVDKFLIKAPQKQPTPTDDYRAFSRGFARSIHALQDRVAEINFDACDIKTELTILANGQELLTQLHSRAEDHARNVGEHVAHDGHDVRDTNVQ